MNTTIKDETRPLPGESVDGKTISHQQKMIWDRLNSGLASYSDANNRLSSRAAVILAGSTTAFGVIASVAIFPEKIVGFTAIPIVLAGLANLAMGLIAASIWLPIKGRVVGNADVDDAYSTYLTIDLNKSIYLAMRDTASVYRIEQKVNGLIAERIKWMVWCLDIQIVFLVVAVITESVT